jgi:hypothetical protein
VTRTRLYSALPVGCWRLIDDWNRRLAAMRARRERQQARARELEAARERIARENAEARWYRRG